MIYGIVGRPGGGKSYEAVAFQVLPALKEGRKVITNLPLKVDHFVAVLGADVRDLIHVVDGKLNDFGSMERPFSKVADYQDDWRNDKGQGALYVVDEAHMCLPNKNINTEILEWYSLHRHYGVDIVLVTQNLRKIHRDIKDMIEVTYYCAKNTALGSKNTYTRKVKSGSGGDVVNTSIRKYEPAYFPFYQSHTASNSSVTEAMAADIVPIWKRWPVIGSVIFLTVGLSIVIPAFTADSDLDKSLKQSENFSSSSDNPESAFDESKQTFDNSVSTFGVLDGFQIFASGYAQQVVYSDDSSINTELTFSAVYFDFYDRSSFQFSLTNYDLVRLGYEFEFLTECVYRVSYYGFDKVITCGDVKRDYKQKYIDDAVTASI